MNTTALDTADTERPARAWDEDATIPRKRRRNFGHVSPPADRAPTVRHATLNGAAVVIVELAGRHAAGREMVLDAGAWNDIAAVCPWWSVCVSQPGDFSVGSGTVAAHSLTGHPRRSHPRTALARVLTGAPRGFTAWYRNDDSFDLRGANLEVITRRELLARLRERRILRSG